MKTFVRSALLATAMLGIAAAPASAQSISQQSAQLLSQLRNEISSRETNAPANEGNQLLNAELATLGQGETRTTHLVANWGGILTVSGFCAAGCGDLDIAVLDANSGAEVVVDAASDNTPIVTFQSLASGDYNLRVTMYNCADKCLYVIASYWRSQ
jgi:hypothetical protein